ncbi:MAG: pilus assembly protein PilM [Candidatus Coatesbacteria bacterium]|nr:pilus assembly protein PilM [Candidatus Coatesbacteria bacterium]
MAKTVIGIDIDASSVKVIEIEPGKEAAVKAFGVSNLEFKEKPSPEELLKAQTEALSEAIASLPPRKKFENVVSLVSGREVRTRILSFPPMPRKEVAGVVEREVRKDAAVPIEDLIYDYSLLRMVRERGQDKQQVMIVSVNRDLVHENISVLRTFGILPAAITTSSTGLYAALSRSALWSSDEAVALIDIGANISTMLIFGSETLYFQREIFTGYDEMKAVFEEGEEEGEMDFGPGVAGGPSSIEEIPALQRVATELKRSFLYYKQQFRGNIIKKLYISGEGARLARVDEFLAEGLEDVEIKFFNPLEGIDLGGLGAQATELETLAPRFATCVGLALDPPKLIRINLVPPEVKAQAFIAIKRFVYAGLVVFVLAIVALVYMMFNARLYDARQRYEVERAAYDELKPGLEELRGVNAQIARFQSYSDLLTKLTKNEPLWSDIYANVGTLVSENMHLESLRINRIGEAPRARRGGRGEGASGPGVESGAKWEVAIQGYAYDDSQVGLQERISRFLNRLEESPFFEEVYLQPSKDTVERVAGEPRLVPTKGAKDPDRLLTEALTTIYSDVVAGTYKQKFEIICKLEGQDYWDMVRRRG